MRFMFVLHPWVVSLHMDFGWQITKLCLFVEQRNGSLPWKKKIPRLLMLQTELGVPGTI